MIITLSRQIGSLGDEIAGRVAAELHLRLADHDFLRAQALAAGIAAGLLDRLFDEEPHNLAVEVLESLSDAPRLAVAGGAAAPNPLGTVFAPVLQLSSVHLEEAARQIGAVIRAVAEQDNILFLEQGSQVVLCGRPGTLHVQIVAPFELRARRIAQHRRLPIAEARRQTRICDHARADYLARYHGVNWLDPLLYHLVINTGLWSADDAVALIVAAARRMS
ncbi:MAG: cytidylate kinase-like family protein [Anaerolineae bacterium]|nr:cytidylate kinase-like family protein [Anaerolineae bacterium]